MSAFSGHTRLSMLQAWLMRRSKRWLQAHKALASKAGNKEQHCPYPLAQEVLRYQHAGQAFRYPYPVAVAATLQGSARIGNARTAVPWCAERLP